MKKKNVSGGQRAGRAKPGASRPSGTKGVTSPVSKRRMDGLFSGVVGHPVKAIGSPIDARLAMGQETLKAFQAASESLNAVLEAYSAVPAIISDRIRIASETIATIAAVPATFSSHIRAIQDQLDMASNVSAKLLSMAGPAFKAQAWPFGHPHLNTGIVDALRTLSSEPEILEAANRALEVAAEFASGLTSAETVLEAKTLEARGWERLLGDGLTTWQQTLAQTEELLQSHPDLLRPTGLAQEAQKPDSAGEPTAGLSDIGPSDSSAVDAALAAALDVEAPRSTQDGEAIHLLREIAANTRLKADSEKSEPLRKALSDLANFLTIFWLLVQLIHGLPVVAERVRDSMAGRTSLSVIRDPQTSSQQGLTWTDSGRTAGPGDSEPTLRYLHRPAPLRIEPQGKSQVVCRLEEGSQVMVVGTHESWARVELGFGSPRAGRTRGWVHRKHLSAAQEP